MWGAILTVGLQIVGWLLDRAGASKESKENFFAWIKKVGSELGSVKLMQYGDKQLEWLKNNPWEETK